MMVMWVGAVMVPWVGCAQNTEQGVQPQMGQGAQMEQPQDTSNRDQWFVILNHPTGGTMPVEFSQKGLQQLATNADEPPPGFPTSTPAKLTNTDELGAQADLSGPGAGHTQIVNLVFTSQADSQQGSDQAATQSAEAAQEATQEIKAAVEVMLQMQAALQGMQEALGAAAVEGTITAEQAGQMTNQLERLITLLEGFKLNAGGAPSVEEPPVEPTPEPPAE